MAGQMVWNRDLLTKSDGDMEVVLCGEEFALNKGRILSGEFGFKWQSFCGR